MMEAIQHQIRIHPVITEFVVCLPLAVLIIAAILAFMWWTGLLDHLADSKW